jgi:ribosomal protein S18 acetylase RimI-like enzyme
VLPFLSVRSLAEADTDWAESLLSSTLGGRMQARRGELIDVLALPGFVAVHADTPVGLLTYQLVRSECELAAIASSARQSGIGTALIDALKAHATSERCSRIWLVTTNDNLDALRFYQRRGFVLRALYANALAESRKLKPRISPLGAYGIPLRDELELELCLPDGGPGYLAANLIESALNAESR